MESWTRTVLGGPMHGQRVRIMHGSTMTPAGSGMSYRRYLDPWWVPVTDTDEQADARVIEYINSQTQKG